MSLPDHKRVSICRGIATEKSSSDEVSSVKRSGSVRREAFNLQVGGFAKGIRSCNESEIGAWSERDWIPMRAPVTNAKSLWEMKRYKSVDHAGERRM